jgi:hypothetical protein
MPLQNRVDPFGAIHAVAARGLFTGNRGVIHDPATRTLLKRRWTTKAWLICECAFRNVRREVMGRNGRSGGAGWTELFFLDEVTALAAGHRPCFYCRRGAAEAFARSFAAGRRETHLPAPAIDARLHRERRASGGEAVKLSADDLGGLPDGAMVERGGRAYALRGGTFLPWSFERYAAPQVLELSGTETFLITPQPTVEALRHGYRPAWHPSAGP